MVDRLRIITITFSNISIQLQTANCKHKPQDKGHWEGILSDEQLETRELKFGTFSKNKQRNNINRLNKYWTMLKIQVCVSLLLLGILALEKVPISHAADPCEGSSVCGSGAKCESRSNMAVCVCPEGFVGDPFVSCRPTPIAASTSTNRNNGMTSTSIYSSSSSSSSPQYTSSSYDTSMSQNSRPTTYHYVSSSSSPLGTIYTSSSSPSRTHSNSGPITEQSNSKYNDNYRTNQYESHRYNDNNNNNYNNQHRNNYHSGNSNNNYEHRPHEFSNNNNNGNRRHGETGSGIIYDRNNNNDNYNNRVYQDPSSSSSSSSYGPINGHRMNSNSNYDVRQHDSEHVRDPLGVYSNCKKVNGVVVCADESDSSSSSNNDFMIKNYDSKPIVHHSSSNGQNYIKPYESSKNQNNDFETRRGSYDDQTKPINGHLQEFVVKSDNPNSPVHSNSNSKSPTQMNDERRGSAINHNTNVVPEAGNPETCKKYCGVNSVCRMLLGRPICGCPEGYTGDPSVRCNPAEDQMKMTNRCLKPTDCPENMVCEHEQCRDPCKKAGDDYNQISSGSSSKSSTSMTTTAMQEEGLRNTFSHYHSNRSNNSRGGKSADMATTMPVGSGRDSGSLCGRNTKCQVIQHTALCGCLDGFTGNPYMGCV